MPSLHPLEKFARAVALAATATLLVGNAVSANAARKTHAELVASTVETQIVPRIERLDKAATALASDLAAFCSAANGADRARIDEDFKTIVTAWAGVDFLRFGPLTEKSRLERFFFWPDPRGVTARQLNQVLASRDEALLKPDGIAAQSVAIQGLSALEILLFPPESLTAGPDPEAQYRCALAAAIGANIASIARDVNAGWMDPQGFRMKILAPGSDNPLYKDAGESARDVVKAVLTGLQIVQDRQIGPQIVAATTTPFKPVRLPFERSKLTFDYIAAEIDALEAMFAETGLAAYTPYDKKWIDDFIARAFPDLRANLKALRAVNLREQPSEETLTTLRKMRFTLNGLRQIIGKELAPAAELTLGFNELDGD